MIIFPGFNDLVYSSTRLEAHRIGFEDLTLLEKLKKVNSQKAEEIIAMVFRCYNDYTKDVCTYRKARRLLLATMQ